MKPLLKVILAGLLAAALALGVRWMFLRSTDIVNGDGDSWYDTALVQARAVFTGQPDEVQLLTIRLLEEPPESILRNAAGEAVCLRDGAVIPADGELTELLKPILLGPDGGSVLNIEVLSDAILFYTCYQDGGCVGFLYEKELGETAYFDYLEIVENWKLFYRLDK